MAKTNALAKDPTKVSIVRCGSYGKKEIEAAIKKGQNINKDKGENIWRVKRL